jgi:hypothetical protein
MKLRPVLLATDLTGPPADKNLDELAVSKLMNAEGEKRICGGTALMAARVLNKKFVVDWVPPKKNQPHRGGFG